MLNLIHRFGSQVLVMPTVRHDFSFLLCDRASILPSQTLKRLAEPYRSLSRLREVSTAREQGSPDLWEGA